VQGRGTSLLIIAVDILVIYGLATYGRQETRLAV
jgi:hypothetical protein